MNPENLLLGQDPSEVKAAMPEKCYGCPNTTLRAAELVHRSKMNEEIFAENPSGNHLVLFEGSIRNNDTVISESRSAIDELTAQCNGYTENKPDRYPSEMCQSPKADHNKIALWAGKALDILRFRT